MNLSTATQSVTYYRGRVLAGVLCSGLVLTAGCGGGAGNATPSSPDVWATVDGHEIKKDDVEKVYKRVAATTPGQSEEDTMTAKLSLLNELIVQQILVTRATALKVEVTQAELDAAFTERKKNMP